MLAVRTNLTSLRQINPSPEENIVGFNKKVKATAKNIEGKIQETVGDLTGDPKNQAEGKAKQAEAAMEDTVENIKEAVQEKLD